MKAIVQHKCGSADVLELEETDKPDITDDEVLVKVQRKVVITVGALDIGEV